MSSNTQVRTEPPPVPVDDQNEFNLRRVLGRSGRQLLANVLAASQQTVASLQAASLQAASLQAASLQAAGETQVLHSLLAWQSDAGKKVFVLTLAGKDVAKLPGLNTDDGALVGHVHVRLELGAAVAKLRVSTDAVVAAQHARAREVAKKTATLAVNTALAVVVQQEVVAQLRHTVQIREPKHKNLSQSMLLQDNRLLMRTYAEI